MAPEMSRAILSRTAVVVSFVVIMAADPCVIPSSFVVVLPLHDGENSVKCAGSSKGCVGGRCRGSFSTYHLMMIPMAIRHGSLHLSKNLVIRDNFLLCSNLCVPSFRLWAG